MISHSKASHKIIPLYDGPSSLAKRIELIEQAQKTIELEFFIYDLDLASQIITKKLIQKAKQGISIRLLVDFSLPVFKLAPVYSHLLKENGVKVKYYNTSKMSDFIDVQHRSHRKLLIVDDEKFITGGRNISNDYFDLSDHYNFLDSDIMVKGPIAIKVRESFDLYWNSKLSIDSELPDDIEASELKDAIKFTQISNEDKKLFQTISELQAKILENEKFFTCSDISFVTDFPGASLKNRIVYSEIAKIVDSARRRVLIETPYFVLKNEGLKLLDDVTNKNVKVDVLTNGLYATDAYYTVSALYPDLAKMSRAQINLYAYDGTPLKNIYNLPIDYAKRWGIHSKRAIVDDKTLIIGTYNVDPRSANLNSELIVVCRDSKELVNYTEESIKSRMKNSKTILAANKVNSAALLEKASFIQKLKFYFVLPVASLFDFLL